MYKICAKIMVIHIHCYAKDKGMTFARLEGICLTIFRAAWMRKVVAPASKKPQGCVGSRAAYNILRFHFRLSVQKNLNIMIIDIFYR